MSAARKLQTLDFDKKKKNSPSASSRQKSIAL